MLKIKQVTVLDELGNKGTSDVVFATGKVYQVSQSTLKFHEDKNTK
jgi:hypothetical protein